MCEKVEGRSGPGSGVRSARFVQETEKGDSPFRELQRSTSGRDCFSVRSARGRGPLRELTASARASRSGSLAAALATPGGAALRGLELERVSPVSEGHHLGIHDSGLAVEGDLSFLSC